MPNAWDVEVIYVPLQSIPSGEGLQTPSDHQSTSERIRTRLDVLLVGHPLFDALAIRLSSVHPNTTTYPLLWFPPAGVSFDMTL